MFVTWRPREYKCTLPAMARFAAGPPNEGRTLLAVLRALIALFAVLALVVAIFYSSYMRFTEPSPPAVDVPSADLQVDRSGRRISYGGSWFARQGGLWQLHLVGSPAAIGDAHGQLTARLFHRLDARLRALLSERFPGDWDAWTAMLGVRWDLRDADAALPEPTRTELIAYAQALPEAASDRFTAYHRLFLYQSFQELAARLEDVLLEGVVFAAAPRPKGATSAGNLIIGRSFAVDLGRSFELDRIVAFYYPDGRYPYVSVGWPGLLGVVTGINARGIFVALNPTRTDDPPEGGAPLALVLRQVMEEADTLEHALEILRAAPLRTSGAVLVGDGIQRKAAVIELSPRAKKEDRRPLRGEDSPLVWATGHLLREPFDRDAQNDRLRRYTASGYRYERLQERLVELSPLDPQRAVDLLRDRRGRGDVELGLGNRNALDHLQLAQAVVVDATAMVLWVAEPPSALGRFRAYDLRYLLMRQGSRPAPLDDIAPDRLLHSEEFSDFQQAVDALAHAQSLLAQGLTDKALTSAKLALALAPDIGEIHRMLGDIERERGELGAARDHYQRYLELVPGKLRDQERVRGLLDELTRKTPP